MGSRRRPRGARVPRRGAWRARARARSVGACRRAAAIARQLPRAASAVPALASRHLGLSRAGESGPAQFRHPGLRAQRGGVNDAAGGGHDPRRPPPRPGSSGFHAEPGPFRRTCREFSQYRSVAPSVTRAVSSSFARLLPGAPWPARQCARVREADAFVVHDTGKPDFLQHRRRVTGSWLDRPTLSERLADNGGAIVFSNVSPGAAYAGRSGRTRPCVPPRRLLRSATRSCADKRRLIVTLDVTGERAMTERFIQEVLDERRPAYALMWLGEPDHPARSAARLARASRGAARRRRNAGRVITTVSTGCETQATTSFSSWARITAIRPSRQ